MGPSDERALGARRGVGIVAVVAAALALTVGATVLVQTAGGADFAPSDNQVGGVLLTIADIDGANGLDLVTKTSDPGVVRKFIRNPDGSFSEGGDIGTNADPVDDAAAAVANLAGNGKRDVALAGSAGTGAIAVTDGAVQDIATPPGINEFDIPEGQLDDFRRGTVQMATGNLRGSDQADLLVATSGGGVLFTGPVGAGSTPIGDLARIGIPTRLALASLDGDTYLDIVAGGEKGVIVLLSGKDFKNTTRLRTTPVRDLTLGRFDDGTTTDLVVVSGGASPHLALRKGAGGGAFESGEHLIGGPDNPVLVGEGDIDRQGGRDLVVVRGVSDRTDGVDTFHLLAGNGDGTFAPQAPLGLVTASPLHVPRLFVTDVDGDGVDDIAFGNDALDGSSIATNKSLLPAPTTGPPPEPPARTDTGAGTGAQSEASLSGTTTTRTVTGDRDRTGPTVGLLARPRRVPVSARAIVLRARCDEACTVTATGRLTIPASPGQGGPARAKARTARTVILPAATASVAGGRVATLRMRIPRRALPALRRALARRAVPVAVIRLRARDAVGNLSATRVLGVQIVPGGAAHRR